VLIPFQESMRVLDTLKAGHDFTTFVAPNAGHELNVLPSDVEEERETSPGLSPEGLAVLGRWLDEHVARKR
jgi:hypothetical protein